MQITLIITIYPSFNQISKRQKRNHKKYPQKTPKNQIDKKVFLTRTSHIIERPMKQRHNSLQQKKKNKQYKKTVFRRCFCIPNIYKPIRTRFTRKKELSM